MTFVFDVKKISDGVYSAKIVDIEDKIAEEVSEFAKYFEQIRNESAIEGGFQNTLDWIASYKKTDGKWPELVRYVGEEFDKKFPNDPLEIKQNVVNEFLEKYCCDDRTREVYAERVRSHIEAQRAQQGQKQGGEQGGEQGGGRKRKKTKKRKHKRKKKTRRRKK